MPRDTTAARRFMAQVERWLVRIVGAVAAVAVLAEVGILLTGVVARFGLNRPLVWSDELASIVFLWLAMLGSVLALSKGEHMRLSTIACAAAGPRWRAPAETLAVLTPLLLLGFLISPALDYMTDQSFIETPALGWSDARACRGRAGRLHADDGDFGAASAAASACAMSPVSRQCWRWWRSSCGWAHRRSPISATGIWLFSSCCCWGAGC